MVPSLQTVYYAPTPAPRVALMPQTIAVKVPEWDELGYIESQHDDDSELETFNAYGQLNLDEDINESLAKLGFAEIDDDYMITTSASGKGKEKEVAEVDRTIFLTFSKG